jgi:hypothetical protein
VPSSPRAPNSVDIRIEVVAHREVKLPSGACVQTAKTDGTGIDGQTD